MYKTEIPVPKTNNYCLLQNKELKYSKLKWTETKSECDNQSTFQYYFTTSKKLYENKNV